MAIGKTNNNLIVPDSTYDVSLQVITSEDNLVTLIESLSKDIIKESYPEGNFFKAHNLVKGKIYVIKISKEGKVLTKSHVQTSSKEILEFDFPHIYGIKRKFKNNKDPKWTRTDDSTYFAAWPSSGSSSGYSDFDKCSPWNKMKRVQLDDSTMVSIPRFYYQRYRDNKYEYIRIADQPVEGFSIHPLFTAGGNYQKAYVGAYLTGPYKLNNQQGYASISGVMPSTGITITRMRQQANAKGTGWRIFDLYTLSAIQMLFLVEFATNNSQAVLGQGAVKIEGHIKTGSADNVPNLTGSMNKNAQGTSVVYRGIEDIWGNSRVWIDGVVISGDRKFAMQLDPSNYATSGTNKLNSIFLGSSYDNKFAHVVSVSYDKNYPYVMMPQDGSSDGGFSEDYCCSSFGYYYSSNVGDSSTKQPYGMGGNYDDNHAGLFLIECDHDKNSRLDYVSSRLIYLSE